jgi:hypothetical protein
MQANAADSVGVNNPSGQDNGSHKSRIRVFAVLNGFQQLPAVKLPAQL